METFCNLLTMLSVTSGLLSAETYEGKAVKFNKIRNRNGIMSLGLENDFMVVSSCDSLSMKKRSTLWGIPQAFWVGEKDFERRVAFRPNLKVGMITFCLIITGQPQMSILPCVLCLDIY